MEQQEYLWESPAQLEVLLYELTEWRSLSGTEGEIDFPYKLTEKFKELDYFKSNPENIKLFDAKKDRNAFTALYKTDKSSDTVVLISHFDTVGIKEYGQLQELAFSPEKLTQAFYDNPDFLTPDAKEDLYTNEYIFGRGTMDMKMGLALHMHLIEQAVREEWPVNLLLVTVPDEEVSSAGMLSAVPGILEISKARKLNIKLFLNGEPSFTQEPYDENHYIYSGSIGKILPAALFYGVPTHAGEPLSGITSHFIGSYLTRKMEFTDKFQETFDGETTPLPVCLQANDLKDNYDVQTSHHSYALYNVFTLSQTAKDVMLTFKEITEDAMHECKTDYERICEANNVKALNCIRVLEYHEVLDYFIDKYSKDEADELIRKVVESNGADERKITLLIADQLMEYCQELAPATVLMFAPPYMPAVNSSDDELVKRLIEAAKSEMLSKYNYDVTSKHYFNGISDLSYVNYNPEDNGWQSFKNNAPLWGETYSIPFEAMQQLSAPVMNIGPYGKDAHKMTERLHKKNAFEMMPAVLRKIINKVFN